MKVKVINGTSNIAWSPGNQHYLACGTTAQQVDATFSTTASLEIHALDFTHHSPTLKGSITTNQRFYKVAWGSHSMTSGEDGKLSGVIVGGTDGGSFKIYNPNKLLRSQSDALITTQTKHAGPVRSLDFNPFQPNLLATGASDSGILIWDLKNIGTPLPSGPPSHPLEEITSLAWNKQVPYILASSFPSRCVMWDLRKYDTIMKVSDSSSRVKCKMVAWHPEIATQLCLASEDDHCPVIQLWDLRFATSPLKTMEYHQQGVLSIAWCSQDPDLLLSCGKDNLIICWNPNSTHSGAEILCEVHADTHWNFDLQWCPRNPGIVAASSFDGKVGVYSLLGAQAQVQTPNPHSPSANISFVLKKAPKWLKRPYGASFGFGGKLIVFSKSKGSKVFLNQVVTEPEILARAEALDNALKSRELEIFCHNKINTPLFPKLDLSWAFIKAALEKSPKTSRLRLLGFDPDSSCEISVKDLSLLDDPIKSKSESKVPSKTKANQAVVHSLLVGNIEKAVCMCVKEGAWPEALILSQSGGPELFYQTQQSYLKMNLSPYSRLILAIITSDWTQILDETTQENWKEVLAALLTHTTDENFIKLCNALGQRLEILGLHFESMLCYICTGNLESLSKNWIKCYPSLTFETLQELIDQIMVVRNFSLNVEEMGTVLSSLLQQYIELLCSQGALYIASTYLMSFELPSLAILKERIMVSLGMKTQVPQKPITHKPLHDKPYNSHTFPQAQTASDPSIPTFPNYFNDTSPNPFQGMDHNKPLQYGDNNLTTSFTFQNKENNLSRPLTPMHSQQSINPSLSSQTKPITSVPHYNFPSSMANVPFQTHQTNITSYASSSQVQTNVINSSPNKPLITGTTQIQENSSIYSNASLHQQPINTAPSLSHVPSSINVPPPLSAIPPTISNIPPTSSNLPLPPTSTLPPPPSNLLPPPSALPPPPSILPSSLPNFPLASSKQAPIFSPSIPSHNSLGSAAPTFSTFSTTSPINQPSYGFSPSQDSLGATPFSMASFGPPQQTNNLIQGSFQTNIRNHHYQMQPAPNVLQNFPQDNLVSNPYAPTHASSPSYHASQVKAPPTSIFTPVPNHPTPPLSPPLPTNIQSGWNDPPPIQASTRTGVGLPRARPRTSSYGNANLGHSTQQGPFSPYNSQQTMMPMASLSTNAPSSEYPLSSQDHSYESRSSEFSFYDPTAHQKDQPHFANESIGDSAQPQTGKILKELSPENAALCNTLEELRERCLSISTRNPQHTRKLEELAKKLENLDSKLREESLPPDVLNGLHQIGAAIHASDFRAGINIYNQLVSGVNFSEISSFMPGIKSLLQTALVLHVQL